MPPTRVMGILLRLQNRIRRIGTGQWLLDYFPFYNLLLQLLQLLYNFVHIYDYTASIPDIEKALV